MNRNYTPITAASNPHIKRVTALLTKAKTRREEQAFVVEGLRLFLDTPEENLLEVFVSGSIVRETEEITGDGRTGGSEAAASLKRKSAGTATEAAAPARCKSAASAGTATGAAAPPQSQREVDLIRLSGKLAAMQGLGIPVYEIPDELMAKISDTKTPQGVLAICRIPQYSFEKLLGDEKNGTAPFLLILENIQDPGNLGTMFRTAEAAGVTGILMSRGTADITNPKTVRATMSAIFRMPFCSADDEESFDEKLKELKRRGVKLYAAHLKGQETYDRLDYRPATGFLIGNEGSGLTERTAALADTCMIIPMQGGIESLNAAMAAGILMYEAARQRRSGK